MIDFHNLTYTYPGRAAPALRDVTVQIAAGEFVLVTGASGAGKSTWLRCLNGLAPHFSGGTIRGRVRVAGLDPIADGPARLSRVVGFVFQNPEAQGVLDRVEADVAFGLENAAVPTAVMRQRVAEVLELLGLTALGRRPLHSLSGGERQLTALAGALALDPAVLALDEPTGQLDPAAAERFLDTIARLNRERGLTVVMTEHRLARVWPYAHRVLHFADGRLAADGPPTPLPSPPTALRASSTAGPVKLQATDLHFAYPAASGAQRAPVLDGASLTLHGGEMVALVGRNGAGKTTLLNCLIGLLRPSAGAVSINGRPLAGRRVADIGREVAYLPQNPDDLLFAETVREELAVTLRNHGLTAGDVSPSAEEWLRRLGLREVADAYPRDLSVGQRQRAALAALLVAGPGIILLDEPTRGLDGEAKRQFAALLRERRAEGKAILLATHDDELIALTADRICRLENGTLHT